MQAGFGAPIFKSFRKVYQHAPATASYIRCRTRGVDGRDRKMKKMAMIFMRYFARPPMIYLYTPRKIFVDGLNADSRCAHTNSAAHDDTMPRARRPPPITFIEAAHGRFSREIEI